MKNLKLSMTGIIVLLLFGIACSKNDNDTEPEKDSYRVKEMNELDNGNDRYTFYYENNKISLIESYTTDNESGSWEQDGRIEVSYDGENMTALRYSKENGIWDDEVWYKEEYKIKDGLLIEHSGFEGAESESWRYFWKDIYQYSNKKLMVYQSSGGRNKEDLKLGSRYEYVYDNEQLAERKIYDYSSQGYTWELSEYEKYTYASNRLLHWIVYNSKDEPREKCVYTYDGDKISSIQYYYWRDDEWIPDGYTDIYSYDENGCLIEEKYSYGNDYEGYRFIYEKGKGNASILWNYPDEDAYGKPTIKSKEKKYRTSPLHKVLFKTK
ncbi:MAG: hypothetical protein N4A59_15300 [Marinifilum sp.]|jgi:hypothetical protein|nr:hypothetical protein [Marinifilum sp.]